MARKRDRPAQCRAAPLKSFVLPGGSAAAAYLHLARTRMPARRAADRRAQGQAGRERRCRGAANTSTGCPISCSSPAAMPTTKVRATCFGSRARIADGSRGQAMVMPIWDHSPFKWPAAAIRDVVAASWSISASFSANRRLAPEDAAGDRAHGGPESRRALRRRPRVGAIPAPLTLHHLHVPAWQCHARFRQHDFLVRVRR